MTVGTVTQEELSLGSHSHFDVLFSIYVLLTTVHHTNVPCREERWGRGEEREGEERRKGEEGEGKRDERKKGGRGEGER